MLANGAGKARARRGGEGKAPAEWRVIFISSGEIGIADKVAEDGRGRKVAAGQIVRVIDVPADAGAGFGPFENLHEFPNADAFARHLLKAASENYGQAGRAFLAEISGKLDGVREAVAGFKNDFINEHCPAGADGQISRVAGRFALVAAAGELATKLNIAPWERGEASNAAATCFRAWRTRAAISNRRRSVRVWPRYGNSSNGTAMADSRLGMRKNQIVRPIAGPGSASSSVRGASNIS